MKDRLERFVALPFTIGCSSESSIAVASTSSIHHTEKQNSEEQKIITSKYTKGRRRAENENESSEKRRKHLASNFCGVHELVVGSFKSFSQIFVYKDDEVEEVEIEMEIGFPTDVKHVTHIGLDGSTTTNPVKGWETLMFPSLSVRQFELAMSAQVTNAPVH